MENENKHTVGALEAFLHDVREGESEFYNELFSIMGENELRYLVEMAKLGEKTKSHFTPKVITEIENGRETKSVTIKNDQKMKFEIVDELSEMFMENRDDKDWGYITTYWLPIEFQNEEGKADGMLEIYFVVKGFNMEGFDEGFVDSFFHVPFFFVNEVGFSDAEAINYIFKHYGEDIDNLIDWAEGVLFDIYGDFEDDEE